MLKAFNAVHTWSVTSTHTFTNTHTQTHRQLANLSFLFALSYTRYCSDLSRGAFTCWFLSCCSSLPYSSLWFYQSAVRSEHASHYAECHAQLESQLALLQHDRGGGGRLKIWPSGQWSRRLTDVTELKKWERISSGARGTLFLSVYTLSRWCVQNMSSLREKKINESTINDFRNNLYK